MRGGNSHHPRARVINHAYYHTKHFLPTVTNGPYHTQRWRKEPRPRKPSLSATSPTTSTRPSSSTPSTPLARPAPSHVAPRADPCLQGTSSRSKFLLPPLTLTGRLVSFRRAPLNVRSGLMRPRGEAQGLWLRDLRLACGRAGRHRQHGSQRAARQGAAREPRPPEQDPRPRPRQQSQCVVLPPLATAGADPPNPRASLGVRGVAQAERQAARPQRWYVPRAALHAAPQLTEVPSLGAALRAHGSGQSPAPGDEGAANGNDQDAAMEE